MSTARKNPNDVDKSQSDAKSAVGTCPLMKAKVQLLPLRYGLVERLDPSAALGLPYTLASRPLGIRLLRDGWLYVIDNTTGYLHEYKVEQGAVSKLLWQGQEAARDQREGAAGESSLLFPRNSTLHIGYSEVQWTAFKCSQMLNSHAEREYFMQRVDLAQATCDKGGQHLLTDQQAEQWLAEVAEPAASDAPPDGAHAEEGQDYVWEHQPLYQQTQFGAVKRQLLAAYEQDHLFLVFKDSIGVMRDLAEEQDKVVGWIDDWVAEERNDLKYVIGNYIETLIVVSDDTAMKAGASSKLFEKTTPEQRQKIYDYINARNERKGQLSSSPSTAYYPGRGFDAKAQAARMNVANKMQAMKAALGDDLYDELEDDIEAIEDHSEAALEGKGLGARGIHDLVRHVEMRQYLEAQRTHLKRWNARLDRITEDRVALFTRAEFHRSAWYFDPDLPDQLMAALTCEQNCVRDLGRTEDALRAISDYFHEYPYYTLPAFASRLDMEFLQNKAGVLVKWLDDARNLQSGLADAKARLQELDGLLGNHWALHLEPGALAVSQAVSAAYSPAIALRLQEWLVTLQGKLNSPDLKSHLDKLASYSNRAHRLGNLVALKQDGATLQVAGEQDVVLFKERLANLIKLMDIEDQLVAERNAAQKNSTRRSLSEEQRQGAHLEKQQLNQQLLLIRQQRSAQVRQIQESVIITSSVPAGFVGVQLKIDPTQQSVLNEEIRRLRAGVWRGYGEAGTPATVLKSTWMPLLALYLQSRNLGTALDTWLLARRNGQASLNQDVVFWGAIFAPVSSALSVYQSAHIAVVDKAFKAVVASSGRTGGMQFAVKLGKLGLGLGAIIAPLALVGSIGTSWGNASKWMDAIRTGSTGEQAGALLALVGDSGSTAVNAALTGKAFAEFGGLLLDVSRAGTGQRAMVLGAAWATRGVRFLSFAARLSPWGLVVTALQFGGEALYNYSHLDDQQRWLLGGCWGLKNEDWEWAAHAQGLAEASMRPVITDKGLVTRPEDGEQPRRLWLTLPGVSLAGLHEHPLRLTAEWAFGDSWPSRDVGERIRNNLHVIADNPLTLELEIFADGADAKNALHLRLAVQPQLAGKPLKHADGYLYYSIPLHAPVAGQVIEGRPGVGPTRIAPQWITVTPEHLHA